MKSKFNRKRIFTIAALTFIGLIILLINTIPGYLRTLSIQQILNRATTTQTEMDNTQGIWHVRIQYNQNPQIFEGDTGSTTIHENYYDYNHGYYRTAIYDVAGNLLHASSRSQQYTYYTQQNGDDPIEPPIVIYRNPLEAGSGNEDNNENSQSSSNHLGFDPAANTKSIIQQFVSETNIRFEGKTTLEDKREVYILVRDNYQTYKRGDGKEEHALEGSMALVFDAETNRFLKSELLVNVDGKDIVLYSVQYLDDEILPLDTEVAWDLSDLPDVTYVDSTTKTQFETETKNNSSLQ